MNKKTINSVIMVLFSVGLISFHIFLTTPKWLEYPMKYLLDFPKLIVHTTFKLTQDATHFVIYQDDLQKENQILAAKLKKVEHQLTLLNSVESENSILRDKLKLIKRKREQFIYAEMMQIEPIFNPEHIWLNKGSEDGVLLGQAAVDENGVIGQIVDVHIHSAKLKLLSASSYYIPVYHAKSHTRAIIQGDGNTNVKLYNLATGVQPKVGDVFLTSGLGGVYPKGIPVAKVAKVSDTNDLMDSIQLAPSALLNKAQVVMIYKQANKFNNTSKNKAKKK